MKYREHCLEICIFELSSDDSVCILQFANSPVQLTKHLFSISSTYEHTGEFTMVKSHKLHQW